MMRLERQDSKQNEMEELWSAIFKEFLPEMEKSHAQV